MFEWNMLYNLINFGILGFGLYKVGKGPAKNLFNGYRSKVEEELAQSGSASENADRIRAGISGLRAAGESDSRMQSSRHRRSAVRARMRTNV